MNDFEYSTHDVGKAEAVDPEFHARKARNGGGGNTYFNCAWFNRGLIVEDGSMLCITLGTEQVTITGIAHDNGDLIDWDIPSNFEHILGCAKKHFHLAQGQWEDACWHIVRADAITAFEEPTTGFTSAPEQREEAEAAS